MKRTVIAIDEEKCDGCGQCVPSCKEGAYREKLAQIVERAEPRSLTVVRMEVPCCSGIAHAALEARGARPIPAEVHVVGIEGGVLGVERFA